MRFLSWIYAFSLLLLLTQREKGTHFHFTSEKWTKFVHVAESTEPDDILVAPPDHTAHFIAFVPFLSLVFTQAGRTVSTLHKGVFTFPLFLAFFSFTHPQQGITHIFFFAIHTHTHTTIDLPQSPPIWPKRHHRDRRWLPSTRTARREADCRRNPASSFSVLYAFCSVSMQKMLLLLLLAATSGVCRGLSVCIRKILFLQYRAAHKRAYLFELFALLPMLDKGGERERKKER